MKWTISIVILIIIFSSIAVIADNNFAGYVGSEVDPWFRAFGFKLDENNTVTGNIIFTGNVSFANVTINSTMSQNISGNVNVSGTISANNFCYLNGTCIGDIYIPYIGANTDIDLNNKSIMNVNRIVAQEINVSNSTLYVGDVKVSSVGQVLNVSGNVSSGYFIGSGKFLTDLNITQLNNSVIISGNTTIFGDLNMAEYNIINTTEICFIDNTCQSTIVNQSLFVPYIGAVNNVNLGNNNLNNTGYINGLNWSKIVTTAWGVGNSTTIEVWIQ